MLQSWNPEPVIQLSLFPRFSKVLFEGTFVYHSLDQKIPVREVHFFTLDMMASLYRCDRSQLAQRVDVVREMVRKIKARKKDASLEQAELMTCAHFVSENSDLRYNNMRLVEAFTFPRLGKAGGGPIRGSDLLPTVLCKRKRHGRTHGQRQKRKKPTSKMLEIRSLVPPDLMELVPFQPRSKEMTLIPYRDEPHCLLSAFHMASGLSVPTSRDMEKAVDERMTDVISLCRQRGYTIATLRCALQVQPRPRIVLCKVPKPKTGWNFDELRNLSFQVGVYIARVVYNNPAKGPSKSAVHPISHFVALDFRYSQLGDSLLPRIVPIDLERMKEERRLFKPNSIRSFVELYQLMTEPPDDFDSAGKQLGGEIC